ncbi:hypothetical protein ABW19_dt0204878 [Dactylella cylindrospora]|nr:hypothetical protein ABW19_dt0204878 [Dactylella cylindrospora]
MELAGGIAGLIALADLVIVKGSKFYSLAKEAIPEIKQLLVEVEHLKSALDILQGRVFSLQSLQGGVRSKDKTSLVYIQDCRRCIEDVKTHLDKCGPKDTSKWEETKASLKWPLNASKTKDMISRVNGLKLTIQLGASGDTMDALFHLLSDQRSVKESLERIEKLGQHALQRENQRILDGHQKEVLDWFTQYHSNKQEDMEQIRCPCTSIWFKDCEEYKDWLNTPNASLWFDGIPGAGKSVLTSAIIQEELRVLEVGNTDTALAYFYVEYSQPESQKFHTMAGSLLRQLVQRNRECFRFLESFRRKHQRDFCYCSPEEIHQLFADVCKEFSTVMLVIDGLDECDPKLTTERRRILDFVAYFGERKIGSIKIMATSRCIPDIAAKLGSFLHIRIVARSTDIVLYTAAELGKRMRAEESKMQYYGIRLQDQHLKTEIIEALSENADGM